MNQPKDFYKNREGHEMGQYVTRGELVEVLDSLINNQRGTVADKATTSTQTVSN